MRLRAARALRTPSRRPGTACARSRDRRAPGSGGRACAPPGPSPFPHPGSAPCPRRLLARALPPPQSQACHGYPPNPHRPARAPARLPRSSSLPPPHSGSVLLRATGSAAAPELCACVPPARPSLPLGRFPSPAQLREWGRGASPRPREVSIDRLSPPLPADRPAAAAAAAARRRLVSPPGQRGQAFLAAPAPPLPACTAASARVGAGEMRSAGGAHWSSWRPGRGRAGARSQPRPPPCPWAAGPRSLPPWARDRAKGEPPGRTATAAPAGEAGPEV